MTAALFGAVLTGGESLRMGRDKALIEIHGVAMVDRVGAALAAVCADVIAVGPARLAGTLRPVKDRNAGEGPLGGLLTALDEARQSGQRCDGVLVVACDLAWLDVSTLGRLIAAIDPDHDVVMARTDRLEPLCAIWDLRAQACLRGWFDHGERAVHRSLGGLAVRSVDVVASALRNVNTPDDLRDE